MKKILTSMVLVCLALGCRAQTKVLDLRQCLDMALGQSYQVQAAQKSIERAKALQGTAWDLDKAELSLSQDPSSGGSTDNAISIAQSMEFPTLYVARRNQLKAEARMERSKAALVKASLASEVKSVYYQLVFEMERLHVLQKQDSILTRYKTVAEARYKAGETRQLETLAAERMHRENKLEMASTLSEVESAQLLLASLLNTDTPVTPAEQALQPLDFVQSGFNYGQTAEGQVAQDKLTVADKAVKVAKNEYAPSLSLTLHNQLVISSWNPYKVDRSRFEGGNFLGFEVGVGIPLFYGATKAKVKAAKKDREIAELEMKQEQQVLRREYLATLGKCNSTFARVAYYQEEGAEKDRQLEHLSHMEYENGEISYVEYIDALEDCIDFHMKKAAAINDYNQSVIALEKLMGNVSYREK